MRHFLLLMVTCLFKIAPIPAQPGCTDPQATNYDPLATSNDGSCVYPTTNYTLVTKTSLSTTLNETSGLEMAGGVVWTHNDSGNQPRIYKIDTLTNTILQTVTVGGASNVDWEDMAFDGTNFYVGDFGNNANGNRTDLKIYKFALSAIPSGSNVTVPTAQVQIINFIYEDQTNFAPQGSNNTSFDCESLFYHDGVLHLFTKDYINQTTTHYVLPNTAGTHEAVNVETYDVGGLITAADITAYGVIALLGYGPSNGPIFLWLLFDYQGGAYFSGNKRRIELGPHTGAGKVEGLVFRNNVYGYVSNERITISTTTVPARLYGFAVSQWLQPFFFPVELVRFEAKTTEFGVVLEWETASEQGNRGFSVERSQDGNVFAEIGFVPGNGYSQTNLTYHFEDTNPDKERYYRLRQQDYDGSEHLSPIAVVHFDQSALCPNTAVVSGLPLMVLADWSQDSQALFADMAGSTVWQGSMHAWNPRDIVSGVYCLHIRDDKTGRRCTLRVVFP
ncbi:MAG: hypothetical protein ABMA02_09400 [Saprospiraceae bacterium]